MKNYILIVEDDDTARKVYERATRSFGYEATACSSAEEALHICQNQKFDLALIDLKLPGIDGLALGEKLLKTEHPPALILITGYAQIESAQEAMRIGFYDYLTKPFDLRNLEKSIHDTLAQHHQKIQDQVYQRQLKYEVSQRTRELSEANRNLRQEIMARKKYEQDLLDERNRAQEYFDIAGVMLMVLNTEGTVTSINKKGCEILGCAESEIVGKNWFKYFIPPQLQQELQTNFKRLLKENRYETENYENYILSHTGEHRLIDWTNRILKSPSGKTIGTLSAGDDITQRKQTEKALQEEQARFKLLTDVTQEGIIFHQKGIIIDVNPAFERLSGYTKEELIGQNGLELIVHPDDKSRVLKHILQHKKENYHFKALKKDNTIIHLEVEPREMDYQGERVRVASIRDITQQIKIEEVLESQRLRSMQADRLHALGEMAAGVAHELNQPLAAISAISERIGLRIESNLSLTPDHLLEMTQEILSMVERMSDIIEHMQIFSRDNSDNSATTFYIQDVITDALKFTQAQLKSHGIDIHLDMPNELPPCWGWPRQIEEVFLNLITNARHALDEKYEKLRVNSPIHTDWVPQLSICLHTDKIAGNICVDISDNGGGIPIHVLPKIFDPFFTTKEVGKGTGLGLSISHSIIQKHGGNLDVQNHPKEGVTFRIQLPITPVQEMVEA